MPVDNIVHLIGFRVPVFNLNATTANSVYEAGVFEPNIYE